MTFRNWRRGEKQPSERRVVMMGWWWCFLITLCFQQIALFAQITSVFGKDADISVEVSLDCTYATENCTLEKSKLEKKKAI